MCPRPNPFPSFERRTLVPRMARVIHGWSPAKSARCGWIFVCGRLGLIDRLPNADRDTLERIVLPSFAAMPDIRSVLFVGCDWYTRQYETYFAGHTYWTIDPDPRKARFGARLHHRAGLESIEQLFASGSFDLIVCNGVFGWGLDERDACEAAFNGCYSRLRDGGHLVLGWNDREGRRPMPLESLASLSRFRLERFEPLGTSRYLANPDNGHTFDFYVKPAALAKDTRIGIDMIERRPA